MLTMEIQTIQRILMNAIILQMLNKHYLDGELVTEEWLTQEYKSKCKFSTSLKKFSQIKPLRRVTFTNIKNEQKCREEQYNDTAPV